MIADDQGAVDVGAVAQTQPPPPTAGSDNSVKYVTIGFTVILLLVFGITAYRLKSTISDYKVWEEALGPDNPFLCRNKRYEQSVQELKQEYSDIDNTKQRISQALAGTGISKERKV